MCTLSSGMGMFRRRRRVVMSAKQRMRKRFKTQTETAVSDGGVNADRSDCERDRESKRSRR